MEHRCGTRVSLSAPALLTSPSRESAAARIVDASVTGAFIETTLKPPLLSRITLRLPAALRAATPLDGCVVRHDQHGIAVEWLDPGSNETIALITLSERETPAALSRPPVAPAVSAS